MSRLLFLFSIGFLFLFARPLPAHGLMAGPGSKDTLILMNGLKVYGEVLDTAFNSTKLKYTRKNGKEKIILVDNDLIFSIVYKDGHEHIIYEQDTSAGNYFSQDDTRLFIYGERDAQKHYHSPLITASSIAIGIGSGYIGSFLSLVPPFAFSGLMLIPKIRVQYKTVSTPEYLNFDTYIMGYEKVARKKMLFRSLVGGIGGMVSGFYFFQVLFPNL